MTDGKRTIQVTDEEFEHIIRLRQELERRMAAGEGQDGLPGGRRGAEFAVGAAAGIAAYWLYKELVEEDDGDGEAEEEDGAAAGDEDEATGDVRRAGPVTEVRPVAVVASDPRRRRRKGR